MPITLTLTQGVLTQEATENAIMQITDVLLSAHQLSGNKVMTPNVTAHVNVLPKNSTYSGGKLVEGAWIETKTPSFALADNSVQSAFYEKASDILLELSNGKLERSKIWTNGVHAVDGSWNMSGALMTNSEITDALSQG